MSEELCAVVNLSSGGFTSPLAAPAPVAPPDVRDAERRKAIVAFAAMAFVAVAIVAVAYATTRGRVTAPTRHASAPVVVAVAANASDGKGTLTTEERPFVVMNDEAFVDLSVVDR